MAKYRKQFALLFMSDPPSAEIFKEHELLEKDTLSLQEGQHRTAKRGTNTYSGVVVRCGKRKDLSVLHVTNEGVVHDIRERDTVYVGTRKREEALIRKQQKQAREAHLRQISETLANQGPEALGQDGDVTKEINRGPKRRPEEDMERLRGRVESLPCFLRLDGDAPLAGTSQVFLNALSLHFINKSYAEKPTEMYRELLRLLIPHDVRKTEGLSFSGKRGTVGIPRRILEAVEAHVSLHSKGEPFVTSEVVKNLLSYEHTVNKPRTNGNSSNRLPPTTSATGTTAQGDEALGVLPNLGLYPGSVLGADNGSSNLGLYPGSVLGMDSGSSGSSVENHEDAYVRYCMDTNKVVPVSTV